MYITSFEELLKKTKKISVEFIISRIKQKSSQIACCKANILNCVKPSYLSQINK